MHVVRCESHFKSHSPSILQVTLTLDIYSKEHELGEIAYEYCYLV